MNRIRRRDFLAGAGAAGALALFPKGARAQVGTLRTVGAIGSHTLPDVGLGYPGYQVLELFLYGGLAPWDTFYAIDNAAMRTADDAIRERLVGCTSAAPAARDFAVSGSTTVRWGMVLEDLFPYLDQARVVVHRHGAPVHNVGVPYGLTGFNMGHPRQAGLGAAIMRRFREGRGTSEVPRAYTFAKTTGFSSSENVPSISSFGAHGMLNRPVYLESRTGFAFGDFTRTLHEPKDPYLGALRRRYAEPLTVGGVRARSPALDILETVYNYQENASSMQGILSARSGAVAPQRCGSPAFGDDAFVSGEALNIACHLLSTNHPDDGAPIAAYAGIVDCGVRDIQGTGYDAHYLATDPNHLDSLTVNLRSTLKLLRDRIDGVGGVAPLDLTKTLVVISTEFGRSFADGSRYDHFSEGFCSLLFGGPYTRTAAASGGASPAKGIAGSLDPVTGFAPDIYPGSELSTHPRTLRGAILMAAGIDPVDIGNVFDRPEFVPEGAPAPSDTQIHEQLGRAVLGFV